MEVKSILRWTLRFALSWSETRNLGYIISFISRNPQPFNEATYYHFKPTPEAVRNMHTTRNSILGQSLSPDPWLGLTTVMKEASITIISAKNLVEIGLHKSFFYTSNHDDVSTNYFNSKQEKQRLRF